LWHFFSGILIETRGVEANNVKIAIPVCNDRISTVFEAAEELLVVDNKPGASQIRFRAACLQKSMISRTMQLKILGIDVLICGALTRPVKHRIEATGIRVISFVRGTVDEILEAFGKGELADQRYILPGCRPDHCCEGRRYRRRGIKRRAIKMDKKPALEPGMEGEKYAKRGWYRP
jgi:predicted Fe-Mo cluster-binding NifX family protein